MKHFKAILLTGILSLIFSQAIPCGWDSDTVAMERKQFPSVLELITGKFLRHSPELYYWRIQDRSHKLKTAPDSLKFDYMNDLGVAYDKIGKHEEAIQTMLQKDKLQPGEYTTYANLGTFYIHNKQYEEGLEFIKKAIEINPEAHFGREVYQQYVVEYVISKRDSAGTTFPLANYGQKNFYDFLKDRHFKNAISKGSSEEKEMNKAIKGIAGMMRFGHFDSPVLLETIGDLLVNVKSGYKGAGHLASRAYLKASYEVEAPQSRKKYTLLANEARESTFSPHALRMNENDPQRHRIMEEGSHAMKMERLHTALKLEIFAGDTWFDSIRTDEINWISSGLNPDSAFAAKYYEDPTAKGHSDTDVKVVERKHKDETTWIEAQYSNPEKYKQLHANMELSDSMRQFLDSIYNAQFAPSMPVDTLSSAENTSEAGEKEEEKESYSANAVLIFGGIVLIIGVLLIIRDSRKAKQISKMED